MRFRTLLVLVTLTSLHCGKPQAETNTQANTQTSSAHSEHETSGAESVEADNPTAPPEASADASEEPDETATPPTPTEGMLLGCIGEACGGLARHLRAREGLPAQTEVAEVDEVRPAAIAAASAIYADLARQELASSAPAATIQVAFRALFAAIDQAKERITAIDNACGSLVAADATRVRPCATLRADARDLVAHRLDTVRVTLPRDLERRVASATDEVQAEVRAAVDSQTRRALKPQAQALWQQAVRLYRLADTPRARAQLGRYGAFAAQPNEP
ncbi:MAG: hypothetical protein AAGE52_11155 [Myxococcota bacterium]